MVGWAAAPYGAAAHMGMVAVAATVGANSLPFGFVGWPPSSTRVRRWDIWTLSIESHGVELRITRAGASGCAVRMIRGSAGAGRWPSAGGASCLAEAWDRQDGLASEPSTKAVATVRLKLRSDRVVTPPLAVVKKDPGLGSMVADLRVLLLFVGVTSAF